MPCPPVVCQVFGGTGETVHGGIPREPFVGRGGAHLVIFVCDSSWVIDGRAVEGTARGNPVRLEVDGVAKNFWVSTQERTHWVRTAAGEVTVESVPDFAPPDAGGPEGGCVAPMPGKARGTCF